MSWVALSLFAALLWSSSNLVDKYAMSGLKLPTAVPLAVLGSVGLAAGASILFTGHSSPLSPGEMFLALASGLALLTAILLYYLALRFLEASCVVALFYLSPLFILAGAALFLGERLGSFQCLGVTLLVSGALLASAAPAQRFQLNRGFWLMIAACAALAVSQVLIKHLLGSLNYWTVFAWVRFGVALGAAAVVWQQRADFFAFFGSRGSRRAAALLLGGELAYVCGVAASTAAAARGSITLVNAIMSIQPFLVMCFSALLPGAVRESASLRAMASKLVAFACLGAGSLLIAQ